jgi:hypothetical protein
MTIITGSYLTVSTVAPSRVLRRHYMAVNSCFGAIKQEGALAKCITNNPSPAKMPNITMTGNFHESGGIK